ncbi:hypothetical protein, partial [Rhodopseudomonas pseudopalustris]|uniref:hypothetical protein n=1 Tax=Rhodopseudomonas pseudopalustris TaxID=1513892 RepID=UPI003F9C37CC
MLRIAVVRERPRPNELRSAAAPPLSQESDDPWRRQLSIGHGCSGPDLATPSINAINMGDDQVQQSEGISVGVVGH